MKKDYQEDGESTPLDQTETTFEIAYKRKKNKELADAKNRLYVEFLTKSNMRAIIFLFHYYGLYKKISINLSIKEPNKEIISIDFESVTENKDGINVFEFFESTEITENKIKKSVCNLFLFILDKIYHKYDKIENSIWREWCERIYWSVDNRDITFDISRVDFTKNSARELKLTALEDYHRFSIQESYFSWIINDRSKYFFIIMFNEYLKVSNLHEEKNDYLNKSIETIISQMKKSIKSKSILYIMVIFDLLPVDITRKKEWLIKIRSQWSKTTSTTSIYNWLNKNKSITGWVYRYITDTVFEKKVPSWMIYFFDWNDFDNKSTQKKQNIILGVLYALNDLSTIKNYNYSFQRLKKSAQKYTERNIIQEASLSKSDIRNLANISILTNEKPEKIISRLIERELLKLKNQN